PLCITVDNSPRACGAAVSFILTGAHARALCIAKPAAFAGPPARATVRGPAGSAPAGRIVRTFRERSFGRAFRVADQRRAARCAPGPSHPFSSRRGVEGHARYRGAAQKPMPHGYTPGTP